MTRTAGALYAFGGVLLTLATIVPTWPDANRWLLLTYAALALLSAGGLELSARHRPLTIVQLMPVAVLGIVIVTLVVLAGGPQAAGSLAVFHVFVLAYGFFYFPLWWALVEVALIGASYGAVLHVLDAPGPWSQWVLVTGAYAVVGAIFGSIGKRMRTAFEVQAAATAQLRAVDDLKTTFLRAVSHELRTPLTNVVGYTTTLQQHHRKLDADRIDDLLTRAAGNARRLEQLLLDLLDIDRLGRGIVTPKLAPTDVGALVRRVIEQLDFRAHPLAVRADPVVVNVDASKVERIVENLVVNAIRHTGPRDPITVDVHAATDLGGGALIVIEDEGPGVPDHLKTALFEPFAQGPEASDSPTPGTGIGLALVLQLTRLHDGTVWIEDRPGGGSRFHVLLPDRPLTPDDQTDDQTDGQTEPRTDDEVGDPGGSRGDDQPGLRPAAVRSDG